jgi:hypothetical protein
VTDKHPQTPDGTVLDGVSRHEAREEPPYGGSFNFGGSPRCSLVRNLMAASMPRLKAEAEERGCHKLSEGPRRRGAAQTRDVSERA